MKILIKEEQKERLKLVPFIYKAISTKRTSLGDNPAFPPYGNFGFEYETIKKTYEEIDEAINKFIECGELKSKDPDYLLSVLSKKVSECKKLEEPIKAQLQKICENIVNETFSVPSETVIFNCKLVGKIKPKKSMRILPEEDNEENGYDFEDVDEVNLTKKVILKRRFINSIIQGISYWLSTDIDDWFDTINNLNENIWNLWYQIKIITDYLLFIKEEKISEKKPMQMSYVEVTLGRNGKKTIIDAQGVIFPYLLRESFRGFLELFSSHGLPDDNKKAMYIIKKSDFVVAEPWDLRLGMGIVDALHNSLTTKYNTGLLFNTKRIPFFFSALCSMKTNEFNDVMQNFLLGTKKGKIIAKEIDSKIVHDIDYQNFKNKIQQKNVDKSLISDGDFSKEELDNYVIQENGITEVWLDNKHLYIDANGKPVSNSITENLETEITAYHGSGSDFDKFNHKKYLGSGAGSQVFGWGTYVSDDKYVANGYLKKVEKEDLETCYKHAKEYIRTNIFKCEDNEGYSYLWGILGMQKSKKSLLEYFEHLLNSEAYNYLGLPNFDKEKETEKKNREASEAISILNSIDDSKLVEAYNFIGKNFSEYKGYFYEVEIPDDNGTNYIEWYDYFPPYFMKRILQGFLRIHDKQLNLMAKKNYPFSCDLYKDIQWIKQNPDSADKIINIICSNDDYEDFFSSSYYTNKPSNEGKDVYRRLQTLFFNSDKAASLFLMQCGFDGIKYPSGTRWKKPDGASEDACNYVIFDANKVKIVNKTKF